ncbi:hypothetical protein [Paenibacillus sp. FSL H7-0331]|uniref:hypothetical protein n=1 Tax=Paenibacillus sp. FSL H7-0331 TaxID=1920421 RepID=UPI00096F9670|nr:hypothetical protein [Paenibacillus sp. FSL H7-0331]OMF19633.1 hypothetical protein BK127_06810 [Paenibacillus sp. FSL H7-0331]
MRQLIILVAALTIILSGCTKDTTPAAKPGEVTTPTTPVPAPTPAPTTTTPAPSTATPPAAGTTTPPATTPPAGTTPAAPEVPRPDGAKEQPTATLSQLEKVEFGMTYDEAAKVMGQMGKLISESQDDGGVNKIQTYEYKTKEGTSIKVTFRNGKVSSTSG